MLHLLYLALVIATEDMLMVLIRYLAVIMVDGDWLNDWLTHLPADWQPTVQAIGELVAKLFG